MIRRRAEPVVRDSTIGGANVQVSGDVAGPVIAGDVTVQVVLNQDRPFHDRYAATRDAFADYHSAVLDREDDLRHLVDGLRRPGSYHLIEAPAFAGKTAFMVKLYRELCGMSWPVAVFYVVERYSNRSGNFLEAVNGQLIDALGADEAIAAPEELHAQFDRLWDDFAALGTADRPAVLLVDGLDEQLATDGIGHLLPVNVADHARVVVTTRSLPDPRAAVPRHHPLGAARFHVVRFAVSRHAKAREDDARHHLETYLAADPVHEKIAALLLVASAPLSRHDLADLLGHTVGEITRHLLDVARCLLPMVADTGGTGYLWGHSTYQNFVADWIGPAQQAQAVGTITDWTTRHAAGGWPVTTPPFLLHGVHHFLRAHPAQVNDAFLSALVSDERRQRLLTAFGHERVFLDTIATVRELLEATAEPDLELLFRLEVHHLMAVSASPFLPTGVLRLLVLSGRPDQAEGVAFAAEEQYRATALAEVAEALTETGFGARARAAVDASWQYVPAVDDDDYWRLVALRFCVRAARKSGAAIPVLAFDEHVRSDEPRHVLGAAEVLLELAQHDDARAAFDVLLARDAQGDDIHRWVLLGVANGLSVLGDFTAATTTAVHALSDEESVVHGAGIWEVRELVRNLVRASRLGDAEAIADSISAENRLRAIAHAELSEALAEAGFAKRAREILRRELDTADFVADPYEQLVALVHLHAAQAVVGDPDLATVGELLDEIEEDDNVLDKPDTFVWLGRAFLAAGQPDEAANVAQRALAMCRQTGHPFMDYNMHDLVCALTDGGDLPGAREVAERNPNPAWRFRSTTEVALAEAAAWGRVPDHYDWELRDRARLAAALAEARRSRRHARRLAIELVEDGIRSGPRGDQTRWRAALAAVDALFRVTDGARSEALLSQATTAARRAEALATLSGSCRATDDAAADRLFATAVDLACRVRNRDRRVAALHAVLRAAGSLPTTAMGVPRLATALERGLHAMNGSALVRSAAAIATTFWHARHGDHARRFAMIAYLNAVHATEWDSRYELCCALARIGEHDLARSLAGKRDDIILCAVAEICADNGDVTAAAEIAEQVFLAKDRPVGSVGEAEDLMSTMLRAGRRDLAFSVVIEYGDDMAERLAYTLFRRMTVQGHELEPLKETRRIPMHTSRAAALVGWAAAGCWSPDERVRNLRLLKEHATTVFTR